MTSTSVGWVLLDGVGPDATTLDYDAFDVQAGAQARNTSQHAAAARGAQAIATASGHRVGSVRVTWTEDIEGDAKALLKSLADLGFDDVHAISLGKATQAWGIEVGHDHTTTALCILEPDAATVMIVATGAGAVRTAVTDTWETAEDLIDWLRIVFRRDGWLPESLYLVGALADLDEVTQPIADALPIPVSDSGDTQLALARGAALATVGRLDGGDTPSTEPRERPWRMSRPKKTITPVAETIAMATVGPVDTDSDSPAAETLRSDEPRSDRPWLVSHARKLTISAAAVAVFGAALSLTASSALNVENTSTQAGEPAAERAPLTSASPYPVLAPISAAPAAEAHPLAAPPARPETIAVPQHSASASPPATVSAAVPDIPLPGSLHGVSPGPQYVAPLGMPPGPQPAAPLAVPAAPQPVAPLGLFPEPEPLGPPPGPQPLGPPPGPQRLGYRLGHRLGPNRLGYRLGHNLRLRLRSLPSLPRRPSLRLLRRPPHRSRRRLRRSLRHQQRRRCPRTLQTRHLHRIRCSPTWGPCSVSCPEQLRLDADGDQIRKHPRPRRAVDAVLIADVNAGALERHLRRAHPGLGSMPPDMSTP